MADEEKFDAVVVGAGPERTPAAITMAKAGLEVALLERGAKPGSKNVMGGILYNHYLEAIVGEDWKQAPLERPIIEERRWLMTPEAAISLDYKNLRNRAHPHSYSVLRARFDAWFAEQAEKAGATVVPETVVDRLITRNGHAVGGRRRAAERVQQDAAHTQRPDGALQATSGGQAAAARRRNRRVPGAPDPGRRLSRHPQGLRAGIS